MKILNENSDAAYEASISVTEPLVKQIVLQWMELPDQEQVKKARSNSIAKLKTVEMLK